MLPRQMDHRDLCLQRHNRIHHAWPAPGNPPMMIRHQESAQDSPSTIRHNPQQIDSMTTYLLIITLPPARRIVAHLPHRRQQGRPQTPGVQNATAPIHRLRARRQRHPRGSTISRERRLSRKISLPGTQRLLSPERPLWVDSANHRSTRCTGRD